MTGSRSAAQIAAMRRWRAAYPEQFEAWVKRQKPAQEAPVRVRSLWETQYISQMVGRLTERINVRNCWEGSDTRVAVMAWINDPDNLLTSHGKTSRFSYRRKGRGNLVFSFTQTEVAFAFKMRFG